MRTDRYRTVRRDSLLAEETFASRPESVASARSWAGHVYASAGGDPDPVKLLVSEVVTNAVRHAGGPAFTVCVLASLWVEVWDSAPFAVPRRRVATEDSTDGRGLEILELLAPDYYVVLTRCEKGVCFRPKGW